MGIEEEDEEEEEEDIEEVDEFSPITRPGESFEDILSGDQSVVPPIRVESLAVEVPPIPVEKDGV